MGNERNYSGDAFDKFLERRSPSWSWIVIVVSLLYVGVRFALWAYIGFPVCG